MQVKAVISTPPDAQQVTLTLTATQHEWSLVLVRLNGGGWNTHADALGRAIAAAFSRLRTEILEKVAKIE